MDRVEILRELFQNVAVPPAVLAELHLDADRPGSRAIARAKEDGWLLVEDAPDEGDLAKLAELLDRGEAEAIALAKAKDAKLLIDERRGRDVARRRGVSVIGTGGVLLSAKRNDVIDKIAPILEDLTAHGYRLGSELRAELLRLAKET